MITGTHYYVSLRAAREYFAQYGYTHKDVNEKINSGDIAIGAPTLKPGQTLSVIPGEGRYAIDDGKK